MDSQTIVKIAKAIAGEHRQHNSCGCHVAFIFKKKKLEYIGVNSDKKSHTLNKLYDYPELKCGTCAELAAYIKGRLESYKGYTMYIIRIDRQNEVNSSPPCIGCQNLLRSMNISQVFYTDQKGDFNEFDLNIQEG